MAWKTVKLVGRKRLSATVNGDSYCLEYPEGKVVNAPLGTLGIFCFTNRKAAEWFGESAVQKYGGTWEVIMVRGEKGIKPKWVSPFTSEESLNCFYKGKVFGAYPLAGTICFKSIEILT